MPIPFECHVGYRYLKGKKRQAFISFITLLSVAGVAVGVTALIVVIAVMEGADYKLRSKLVDIQPHILVMHYGSGQGDYNKALDQVRATDGVTDAAFFLFAKAMLRSGSGISGALIKGISIDNYNGLTTNTSEESNPAEDIRNHLMASPHKQGLPQIVLGRVLAEELQVKEGDLLMSIAAKRDMVSFRNMPAMKRLQVAAVIDAGLHEINKTFAWMRLEDAQYMMGYEGRISGIEVRIRDVMKAKELAAGIEKKLKFPFWTRDWMGMNYNLFASLKLQKTVMFIILTLIVLVAGFCIASTLIMMVMEKTRDIAILKAMGATGSNIGGIFVFNGLAIGGIGTLIGTALGFIICTLLDRYKFIELKDDVYLFSSLPVRLEPSDVIWISLASMTICLLASIFPAFRASRMNPVDAIREGQ